MYFTNNDGSQNMFDYQLVRDTLELKKKTRALIIFLVGNQREYILLNLSHYLVLSRIVKNFLDIE